MVIKDKLKTKFLFQKPLHWFCDWIVKKDLVESVRVSVNDNV